MKNLFILAAALFISACATKNQYEKTEKGLEYQVIQKTENGKLIESGQIAELNLKFFADKTDSLIYNSADLKDAFRLQVNKKDADGGSFDDAILLMATGDSMHFLLDAETFFMQNMRQPLPEYMQKGDKLRFQVKLVAAPSMEKLMAERQAMLDAMKTKETELIQAYLKENNINVEPTSSGIYLVYKEKGKGPKTEAGKKVSVHYTGRFLTGEKFDSSLDRNQPFEFVLGVGQVIPAWDEAVSLLKVGDKVTIVAPSHVAYGETGAGQTIPPYSALVFDIEVLSIAK